MSETDVSVVVPVLNGAKTIADMLRALVNQSRPPSEIIVVDGGSTDGTKEIVRSFNVTLLEELKAGPAAARNLGLREVSGELVAHIDADAIPTRRWLSELIKPFEDPTAILTGGRTISFPGETPVERFMAALDVFQPKNNILKKEMCFVPSVNMAVRREHALAVGGWSEDLLTAEDIDFCHRILRRFPGQIRYVSDAIVFHHNRVIEKELQWRAWTYGEGAAQIYLRYPDVIEWNSLYSLKLGIMIANRTVRDGLTQLGRTLGIVPDESAEFAHYHRLWTLWFWGGFFNMHRTLEHKSPRPVSIWQMHR